MSFTGPAADSPHDDEVGQPFIPREYPLQDRSPVDAGPPPVVAVPVARGRFRWLVPVVCAAVLIVVAAVAGFVVLLEDTENADAIADNGQTSVESTLDESIAGTDFENIVVKDDEGNAHRLENGTDTRMTMIEDPVFADADGDGIAEAAVVYQQPADSGVESVMFLWRWVDGAADQVEIEVASGEAEIGGVTAADNGFGVTVDVLDRNAEVVPEDIVVGLRDDYPIVVEPTISAVDRCGGYLVNPVDADPVPVRAYPENAAPVLAPPGDLYQVTVFDASWTASDWHLVQAEREDGTATCGWASDSDLGLD